VKISRICALSALLAASVARAENAPVEPGKVYLDPDGTTVAIVPLLAPGPAGEKQVLLYVTGSGSDFDGKAIPHQIGDVGGGNANYQTRYHGRPFTTIPLRQNHYALYVPGGRGSSRALVFDQKKTQELKPDEIYRLYQKQKADGTLSALQSFNRKAETAGQDQQLRITADDFARSCGAQLRLEVDWGSISDDDIMAISVASFCGDPIAAMRQMCEGSEEAKAILRERVKGFACRLGKSMGMELAGTTLRWTASRDASNVADFARAFLEKNLVAGPPPGAVAPGGHAAGGRAEETPPWGKGETLGERTALEKTVACTDGKAHYVLIAPHPAQLQQLYYGDGKRFFHVPLPNAALSGDKFFEPRFWARGGNPDFRGLDMRLYSSVDVDAGRKTCSVTCGDRKTDLTIVDPASKRSLLTQARYEASPQQRVPHHLARDKVGTYYYVDRGSTPETDKSFRLFVGPKGRMKLQRMTNVVADSEGEIFVTRNGSLRYIVGKSTSDKRWPLWINDGKETRLSVIPIEGVDDKSGERTNNYGLIYNELGVYLGNKLGNPCDDL
jgi:hypothetical protein